MFNDVRKRLPTTRHCVGILLGMAALVGCYATSRYNIAVHLLAVGGGSATMPKMARCQLFTDPAEGPAGKS